MKGKIIVTIPLIQKAIAARTDLEITLLSTRYPTNGVKRRVNIDKP